MIYYQVNLKGFFDTKELRTACDKHLLIDGELYTAKELDKIKFYPNFDTNDFQKIVWNKNKTIWFFGKRIKIERSWLKWFYCMN